MHGMDSFKNLSTDYIHKIDFYRVGIRNTLSARDYVVCIVTVSALPVTGTTWRRVLRTATADMTAMKRGKTHILTICCCYIHLFHFLRSIYGNPQWLYLVNRTQRGKKRLLLFAGSNSGFAGKDSAKHYKSQARWAIYRPRLEPRT